MDATSREKDETQPRPVVRRVIRGRRLPENLRVTVRLDRRTLAGKDATAFRVSLMRHCQNRPSETQLALIELAVQLKARLVVMDLRFADCGEQSEHDARQYLAWVNSLQRALSRLGLESAAQSQPTRDQVLAALYGHTDGR
jgi:hypothetical protein